MSSMKDLFDALCEKFYAEHFGYPKDEIADDLQNKIPIIGPLTLWAIEYLSRPAVDKNTKVKKQIFVYCTDKDEAEEIAFNIHKQLMDNEDYLLGRIVVTCDNYRDVNGRDTKDSLIRVHILDSVKDIPEILL